MAHRYLLGILLIATLMITACTEAPAAPAGEVGETVVASIAIAESAPAAGAQLTLTYNSNIVVYRGTEQGGFLSEDGTVDTFFPESTIDSSTPGVVSNIVILRLDGGEVAGSGSLAQVQFERVREGDPGFAVSEAIIANAAAEPVDAQVSVS